MCGKTLSHICFYTNELYPVTRGGIGALIGEAVQVLLARGHRVTILSEIERGLVEQFRKEQAPQFSNSDNLTIYALDDLANEQDAIDRFATASQASSFLAMQALIRLENEQKQQFDLIEFPDVRGIAYCTIAEKKTGRHFTNSRIVIRTHGALEYVSKFEAYPALDFEHYFTYRSEQYCLQHADLILCPSQSWAQVCMQRYSLAQEKLRVSPPPLSFDNSSTRTIDRSNANIILCHGKLQMLKGVELFVDAAVRLFALPGISAELKAVLTGGDLPRSPELGSVKDFLLRRIPDNLKNRFEFAGHIGKEQLMEIFAQTRYAVIPSRVESFSYAAHELRAAGIPLILNDIPAFQEVLESGRNCLKFDGTTNDLLRQMQRLLEDTNLYDKLCHAEKDNVATLSNAYEEEPASFAVEQQTAPVSKLQLTVLLLSSAVDREFERATLASLIACQDADATILLFRPWSSQQSMPPVWLRGKPWIVSDNTGQQVQPQEIKLVSAALILEAGDKVDSQYVALAGKILAQQPDVGMVACWHTSETDWKDVELAALVHRFPWEVIPELAPLVRAGMLNRAIFRIPEATTLETWCDDRFGALAEIALVWKLIEEGKEICTIPQELMHCQTADINALRLSSADTGRLSLLFDRGRNQWLQTVLPQLFDFICQQAGAETGPVTLARLGLAPNLVQPQKTGFYGKKWLLAQLWRELRRSPVPGFLKEPDSSQQCK
jgi:glycosyltransferase involved in cell wall biosynthesis